jgi:hypothetical protein
MENTTNNNNNNKNDEINHSNAFNAPTHDSIVEVVKQFELYREMKIVETQRPMDLALKLIGKGNETVLTQKISEALSLSKTYREYTQVCRKHVR